MQTGLLTTIIVLLSATLIVLVIGVILYLQRISVALREAAETLKAAREEITPLARDTGALLKRVDDFAREACEVLGRVNHVVAVVERHVEGKSVTDAAAKAVSASRATVVSVLEGLREGLKTLKGSKNESRESKTADGAPE